MSIDVNTPMGGPAEYHRLLDARREHLRKHPTLVRPIPRAFEPKALDEYRVTRAGTLPEIPDIGPAEIVSR
jgi:hypothetical protein